MTVKYISQNSAAMILMLLSSAVSAEEKLLGRSAIQAPYSHYAIDYGQVIYGTLVVFVILGLLILLLKKSRISKYGSNGLIEIINSLSISTKEKLLVIRAGSDYLLVGISSSGINKLHELDENDVGKLSKTNNIQINSFTDIYSATIGKLRNA